MDLTASFERAIPQQLLDRYEFRETRNAAAILASTNPVEFAELIEVLDEFALLTGDLVEPGGNESGLAKRLNTGFRSRGWREGRVDTRIAVELSQMPYKPAGESAPVVKSTEVFNEGYRVDNVKGRIALDVEWNAKDGNLDRDIGAYRALYDAGLIDMAVMITRTHDDLRKFAQELGRSIGLTPEETSKILNTSTTTNLKKLEPKLTRGDAGGCPVLAICICPRTWSTETAPPAALSDAPKQFDLLS